MALGIIELLFEICGPDLQYLLQKIMFQNPVLSFIPGYNCSLFAYGQTGSGKSYSMVGYGNNRGIVPIICDELFKTMKTNAKADMVSCSQGPITTCIVILCYS